MLVRADMLWSKRDECPAGCYQARFVGNEERTPDPSSLVVPSCAIMNIVDAKGVAADERRSTPSERVYVSTLFSIA